jgi:protein tyrosine phosphatase (PTP) superfamily phosphohydrolase (DUF442 family)
LPGEVTRSVTGPPAASPGGSASKPAADTGKGPDVKPDTQAPAVAELDLTSATAPAPEPSPSASVGPGIARFVAVDLKLAGGSVPSDAGLKWLVEKGYRTVLDLRESAEVPSSFIALVANHGLRYVALPIGLKSIDRNHIARFNFEIAAGEARPLFFFDSDGTRAGALWYIRRITNDRVDRQIAKREAEELGLSDRNYWAAVTDYVTAPPSVQKSAAATGAQPGPASPQVSTSASDPRPAPGQPLPATGSQPRASAKSETGAVVVSPGSPPPVVPALPATEPIADLPPSPSAIPTSTAQPSVGDSLSWRPFAAMVVTGLSLPLAYWSRTAVPMVLAKARASLPAPALRPKSIRGELGA